MNCHLTPRQTEVLALVADGKRNKEIAHLLSITGNTVKVHLSVIFNKLGVRNRVEATRYYLRSKPGGEINNGVKLCG